MVIATNNLLNLITILTTAKSYEDIDKLRDLVEQNISFD